MICFIFVVGGKVGKLINDVEIFVDVIFFDIDLYIFYEIYYLVGENGNNFLFELVNSGFVIVMYGDRKCMVFDVFLGVDFIVGLGEFID